ncbi:hypothetical protein HO133_007997 [Letharia lupina]|uniref:Rhodopsin domain-containing protein n=1 Tax=Letharia lupina TaxID=560253 RepID=A0A8H6CRJ8_9LECA|nr:uncharacterized protein HO133_007997 [Letharia lupina]KAF6228267.1 hypothetical protein HO133_007997 [Letharia lupina]
MAEQQENRTPTIVATVTALWVLSYIAVGARFWGRFVGHSKLWWDDWLILLAAVMLVPALTADLIECHLGAGKHVQAVVQDHPGNIVNFLKSIYAGEIFYPPIIVCIKCSILTLYYRLFGIRKGIARVCHVLLGMTVAWGIATLLPAVFQCKPIHVAWDPTSTRNECFKLRPYLVGTNVPNVLLDCAILVTPLYPVWQLQLPRAKKVLISGIFVLGACETAFSIVRLVELTSLDISDVTWDYLPPIIWSTVEICVGMFCACLPVMAPLVPKFMRGRSGPKEPYDYSSFGPTNTARVTNGFAKQEFDRLEDDTAGLVLGRDHQLSIRQTTNIDVHEEGSIALHTMA